MKNPKKTIFATTHCGKTGTKETERVLNADSEGMGWLHRHLYWAILNDKVVTVGEIIYSEPPE